MCGISGVIFKNNLNNVEYIKNLIKYLHNRGPDKNDYYNDNNVYIGHNRLSIIDLDTRSNQPYKFKNFIMVFNGEIYNYNELKDYLIKEHNSTFITSSDTEVLIQLFYYIGIINTLTKLNGMFSIGLYDIDKKELYIMRDRIGIKFCYYYYDNDKFIFASNPGPIAKTLYDIDKQKFKLNTNAFFSYLSSGICLEHETMFDKIYGLNAGYYIHYDITNNIFNKKKWWNPNMTNNNNLIEAIQYSIYINETSDVDGTILFSGGIDSGTISMYNSKFDYLTVDVGELKYTKDFLKDINKNEKLQIINNDYVNNDIDLILKEQRKIINFSGIPAKISYIMILCGLYLKNEKKEKKIVLSGIGGNELFYGHRRIKTNDKGINFHIKDIFHYLNHIIPYDNNYKDAFINFKNNIVDYTKNNIDIPIDINKENIPRWIELKTFLMNDLLINSDSVFMYYSIESRVPLLDHNIVEIALSKEPKTFFYDENIINKKNTWDDYTFNSKKCLKELLISKVKKENLFRQKINFDVQKHLLEPLYLDLCDNFLNRKIIGINGSVSKFNAMIIGNIELFIQEYEYLLII